MPVLILNLTKYMNSLALSISDTVSDIPTLPRLNVRSCLNELLPVIKEYFPNIGSTCTIKGYLTF